LFGSLGFTEIAFVLVLALLLFGPKRLPEIGRTIGKGMAEFRRASNDLRRTLEREVQLDELEGRRPLPPAGPPAPVPARPVPVESSGTSRAEQESKVEKVPDSSPDSEASVERTTESEVPTVASSGSASGPERAD
jgi:TatA/E family protein of Tat protein translocase